MTETVDREIVGKFYRAWCEARAGRTMTDAEYEATFSRVEYEWMRATIEAFDVSEKPVPVPESSVYDMTEDEFAALPWISCETSHKRTYWWHSASARDGMGGTYKGDTPRHDDSRVVGHQDTVTVTGEVAGYFHGPGFGESVFAFDGARTYVTRTVEQPDVFYEVAK